MEHKSLFTWLGYYNHIDNVWQIANQLMLLYLVMFNQKHVNHTLSVQQYFSSVMQLIHCHISLLLSEKGKKNGSREVYIQCYWIRIFQVNLCKVTEWRQLPPYKIVFWRDLDLLEFWRWLPLSYFIFHLFIVYDFSPQFWIIYHTRQLNLELSPISDTLHDCSCLIHI